MPSKNILGIKLVVNLQSNYPNHNYDPEELLLLIVTDYFCYGQIHATQTYPGRARSALYRLRDVLPHSVEQPYQVCPPPPKLRKKCRSFSATSAPWKLIDCPMSSAARLAVEKDGQERSVVSHVSPSLRARWNSPLRRITHRSLLCIPAPLTFRLTKHC